MESRVTTAVSFITHEGPRLHDGIGGSSHFDKEVVQFVPFRPYLQLAEALKIYVPPALRSEIEDDSRDGWDRLSERISQAETGYSDTKNGFWHRLWYNIGESEDICNAWVALIPDSYGLAVVKTGLAVVFQLAGKSVTKRQNIFDTFMGLRDALMRASPTERSFRDNKIVGDCADQLYQAVVHSIEDMILVTSKDKSSWRNPITKLKRKSPPPNPDEILQRVTDSTDKFERALGNARDQTIEATNRVGQYNAILSTNIHHDVKALGTNLEGQYSQVTSNMKSLAVETRRVREGIDRTGGFLIEESEKNEVWRSEFQDSIVDKILGALDRKGAIAARENAMQNDQLSSRNELLGLLLAQMKKRDEEVASLRRQVNRIRGHRTRSLVDLNSLSQILAQSNSSSREPVNLDRVFQHPNDDFELALMQQSRFTTATQSQVQSLLQESRFFEWMSCKEADMILVDANISSSDLGMSAISVFSATLISGLVKLHPNDVVIHFFCSLHTSTRDAWYGPNGLVRSLIIQVLMRLIEMKILALDFVDDEEYLMDLDKHDLARLCDTLSTLVGQFPPSVTVYCIIDSISSFDNSLMFKDVGIALDCIQQILEDRFLAPIFNVLITNPSSSTRRVKELLMLREYPNRLISLSSSNLTPIRISSRSVENHLLRRPSPVSSLRSRDASRSRS